MKKICAFVLAMSMALTLAACGGGGGGTTSSGGSGASQGNGSVGGARDTYVSIKVGTSHNAESFFAQGLYEWERLVEENTKGAVQIEVFCDEALGSEGEMAEGVSMGTVDACLIGNSSLAKLDSKYNVFSLPYLFSCNEHADAVMAGEPGDFFRDEIWNLSHVMVLDYWDSGFRNYSSSVRELNGPEDLAGQLIRIPDNPIQAATAAALGATTSTLSYKEVYLACSNKTVDGQEGPVFAFVDDNFYEVQQYMVLDGHIYTSAILCLNGDIWEKLTEDDQKTVLDAAYAAGLVEKEGIRSSEAEQIKFLKEQGMIINENPDKEAWRAATAPVYDQFRDTYGADLIQQILDYPY